MLKPDIRIEAPLILAVVLLIFARLFSVIDISAPFTTFVFHLISSVTANVAVLRCLAYLSS